MWVSIGRYIFPWAGKNYEKISPRKLSMMLDESPDLAKRYPGRVHELKLHQASLLHYNLVLKNQQHYWKTDSIFTKHLKNSSWDNGMSDEDKEFWKDQAENKWVSGNNIQDKRILPMDLIFKMLDMNYQEPLQSIQKLANQGPGPFVRQGYIFLGHADQESILPMSSSETKKKRVFKFHYRSPMIGGAVPIGFCLDEIVEIAQGLFLGQLIYSTALTELYRSSVDPTKYECQLLDIFC